MGVESEDNHKWGEQDSVPPQDHLVQPATTEPGGEQRAERPVTVPVVVVTQVELEALHQQLAEARAKAARYDRQLEKNRESDKRWRASDPERVRALARERQQRHRARKRQVGGS